MFVTRFWILVVLTGVVGCATTSGTVRVKTVAEVQVSQAIQLQTEQEYEQALELLAVAFESSTGNRAQESHIYLHMVHTFYLKGAYTKALQGYRAYLERYPDAPVFERARVAYQEAKLSEELDMGLKPPQKSMALN